MEIKPAIAGRPRNHQPGNGAESRGVENDFSESWRVEFPLSIRFLPSRFFYLRRSVHYPFRHPCELSSWKSEERFSCHESMENIHFEEKYKNIVDRSMGKYIESSIVEYFHESVICELSIQYFSISLPNCTKLNVCASCLKKYIAVCKVCSFY